MNPHDINPFDSQMSQEQLDRLVDGALAPDEYRQTVAALDETPQGWRRCALAFLESQALGRELSAIVPAAAPPSQQSPSVVASERNGFSRGSNAWQVLAAMAACFLAGFGLDAARQGWPFGQEKTKGPAVVVEQGGGPGPSIAAGKQATLAGDAKTLDFPSGGNPALAADPQRRPLGRVTLLVGSGDNSRQVEIPVYDEATAGSDFLSQQASAIPPEMLEALRRAGHGVRQQQHLVPVDLRDGRRMMVPVEQVEIVPVGGTARSGRFQ